MKTALLLCCLLHCPPVCEAADFNSVLREGLLALQKGELKEAAARLDSATELNPTSGIAWAALAQTRFRLGELIAADTAATQAEAVGAAQPVVLRTLLLYWSGRGNQETVARLAASALNLENRPEYHHLLGKAELARGRYEAGLNELRKAAATSPVQERFAFDLAQALLTRQRFDEAAQVLEAASKEIPGSAQLQLALGVARYGQRRFEDAITSFLATIASEPDAEQPYIFLGKMLDQAGDRLSLIEQQASVFLKTNSRNAAVHLVYAKSLLRRSDPPLAEAERHLRQAIEINSGLWDAHFELGVLLIRNNKYPEAATELEAAVKCNPQEPAPHYHLARVFDRLGKPDKAAEQRSTHQALLNKAPVRR